MAIDRGLSYAPYADVLWMETSKPDLREAKEFSEAIRREFPDKILAYNCSPSFNWSKHLTEDELRMFQVELGRIGYMFQFVTLAGFHTINQSMFRLATHYKDEGMLGYSTLQKDEFLLQECSNFDAVKHQRFVGTGYFDKIQEIVTGSSTTVAMRDSTEKEQF